jgi:hypothetical protein
MSRVSCIGAYNNQGGRRIVTGRNGVQAVLVNLQCTGCAQARCRVLVKGVEVTQSTSCPLILKRASAFRLSGEWSDDDYDVLADGVVVGRIMKWQRWRGRQAMERWPTATATSARKLSWHVVSVQPTRRSFRGLLADPFSTNSSVETGKSAGSAQPNRSQDSRGPPTS